VSGVSSVIARLGELDARIRTFDPGWAGVGGPSAAGGFVGASATQAGSTRSASGASESSDFGALMAALASAPPVKARDDLTAAGAVAFATRTRATRATLLEPVPGAGVTLTYGPTDVEVVPGATVDGVAYDHFHQGMDFSAPIGTPVRAAAAGTVIEAGRRDDGAVVVRIRHADGSETLYGHLEPALAVQVGDTVSAGRALGSVGMTGNTTGPHLHFEVRRGGRTVDPAPLLYGSDATSYEPAFVTERKSDTPWDDCTLASAAMLVDYASGGMRRPSRAEMRDSSGVVDRLGMSDPTTLGDAARAVGALAPEVTLSTPAAGLRVNWDAFLGRLAAGDGAVIQGRYGDLSPQYRRWDTGFDGGHALFVLAGPNPDTLWVMDPLAPAGWSGEAIPASEIRRFAAAYTYADGSLSVALATPIAGGTAGSAGTEG
jgi:hypothetical protein